MPSSATAILSPPIYLVSTEDWKRLASQWMRNAHQGHIAATSTFTCLSGTVSTILTDSRIGAFSHIGFTPTSANAAAENPWVASRSKGAATITHANAGSGDRTFTICILG